MTFVIEETKVDMLTTLVEQGKNCLMTGATGSGKTTLCVQVAERLGLDPIIINMGSTQDARSSLLGFFTLEKGETVWQDADFLKAIQRPNTLVILDELSRASDDAYNIIFPVLDFRRNIRVDEKSSSGDRIVEIDPSVRFIATANVGLEYSSARSIDRAMTDRFMLFNLPYITGKELGSYISKEYGSEAKTQAKDLLKMYDYSLKLYKDNKISTRLSPRMVLNSISLLSKFNLKDVLDYALLPLFEADSTTIVNDANKLREFADSLGVYNNE